VATVRRALPDGDYSIEALEDRVAVECKTLDDFCLDGDSQPGAVS
jgi:ERCC4-type nuclease